MKKIIYGILIMLLVLPLVGCSSNSTDSEKNNNESKKTEKKKIGDIISFEFGEVSLDNLEVKNRYDFEYSGNTTNTYFIAPTTSDLQLVSLRGKLTNKTSDTLSTEFASLKLINGIMEINGNKYEVKFDDMSIEDATGYDRILSQQTVDYFLYAEVPGNVTQNITSCKIIIGIKENFGDNQSDYEKFNIDNYDYVYEIDQIPTYG